MAWSPGRRCGGAFESHARIVVRVRVPSRRSVQAGVVDDFVTEHLTGRPEPLLRLLHPEVAAQP